MGETLAGWWGSFETFLQCPLFNGWGALASILGCVVSVFVFFRVRSLAKELRRRIRVPQLLTALEASQKNLRTFLTKKLTDPLTREYAKLYAHLEALVPKLREAGASSLASKVKNLSSRITAERNRNSEARSAAELEAISDDLQAVIQELQHLIDDQIVEV